MNHSSSNKHFVEAMETLSSIASLELDAPVAIQEVREYTVQGNPLQYRTVHWLHHANKDKIVKVVKSTFRTVLGYLQEFYRKEFGHLGEHDAYESIQNMMALVNTAAKKLDRFSHHILGLHDVSVKESQEFRDLHAFYERKVAPLTLQESLLSSMKMLPVKAVIEVSKLTLSPAEKAASHVYVDLETVKNDGDYELFHIRREDGSRFFSPRLIKSVQVVAHFDKHFSEDAVSSASQALQTWMDYLARGAAQNLLMQAHEEINEHVKTIRRHQGSDLSMLVYQAIQALFLAAHAEPHAPTGKRHSDYFLDFQRFIRDALTLCNSVHYESRAEDVKPKELIDLLMQHLFEGTPLTHELTHFLDSLHSQNSLEKAPFSEKLQHFYDSLVTGTKGFQYAPLIKVLKALERREIRGFDPYMMQNLPSRMFEIKSGKLDVPVYRLPTPTAQEYVQKAAIIEEFKSHIKQLGKKKHLLINLQDRTSLREFARAHALEEYAAGVPNLECVTMTKESDFYHQAGPYSQLNQTAAFIDQLLEHVQSEASGYYYPEKIKAALFPEFAKEVAHVIHTHFFQGHNVLPRSARLDFIELFYLILQLKIVELVNPYSMSFVCKDGLDISLTTGAECLIFLRLLEGATVTTFEQELLENMLFALPLITRGRNLFQDRFHRMTHLMKLMETGAEEHGGVKAFGKLLQADLRKLFGDKLLAIGSTIS